MKWVTKAKTQSSNRRAANKSKVQIKKHKEHKTNTHHDSNTGKQERSDEDKRRAQRLYTHWWGDELQVERGGENNRWGKETGNTGRREITQREGLKSDTWGHNFKIKHEITGQQKSGSWLRVVCTLPLLVTEPQFNETSLDCLFCLITMIQIQQIFAPAKSFFFFYPVLPTGDFSQFHNDTN